MVPCGLVISQDIFQRKLNSIFNRISNMSEVADDLPIFGFTKEKHDSHSSNGSCSGKQHWIQLCKVTVLIKQSLLSMDIVLKVVCCLLRTSYKQSIYSL